MTSTPIYNPMLFQDVFPENIVAFVSNRSVDFKLADGQSQLSLDQKSFVESSLGFPIKDPVNIRQVHGHAVVVIQSETDYANYSIKEADAITTNVVNVPIVIRTADCVPVFLHDTKNNAIALIHAGWKSTQQRIVQETLRTMKEMWGTRAEDVKAALGPAIQEGSCEVGNEFKQYFPNETLIIDGRLHCDIPQANINQLMESGVLKENIVDSQIDTVTNLDYFSYRREADAAGRMILLMMIKE